MYAPCFFLFVSGFKKKVFVSFICDIIVDVVFTLFSMMYIHCVFFPILYNIIWYGILSRLYFWDMFCAVYLCGDFFINVLFLGLL